MQYKLQNIHTGELWVKSDSEVCARFIHSSDIIFDIEYDDSLSIWKYPDRFAECATSSVMIIDENPVPYRAWTIKFFSDMDTISIAQFSAIEKTIDIRNSVIVNSNPHFDSLKEGSKL